MDLAQDETLDYERKRTYRFTVSVSVSDGADQDGAPDDNRIDDTISVTVNVTDVNEPPVITGEAERELRENGTSAVANYSAKDPEGDSIIWSVSGAGADNSTFVMTDRAICTSPSRLASRMARRTESPLPTPTMMRHSICRHRLTSPSL